MNFHSFFKFHWHTKYCLRSIPGTDEENYSRSSRIHDSTSRFVEFTTARNMQVVVSLVAILGFTFFLANEVMAEECYGPVTGGMDTEEFDFTYESWMKEHFEEGVKVYRFERCVMNNHNRPLWVEWESTGLKGVSKAMDAIYVYFHEPDNQNEPTHRNFWFGPRPEKLEPSTVLRPNEASAAWGNGVSLKFAQFDNSVSLESAFADQSTMVDILQRRIDSGREQGLTLVSGGRIAVPTKQNALYKLQSGETIDLGEFVAVDITLVERFRLSMNTPIGTLSIYIHVAQDELNDMNQINGEFPILLINDESSLLSERLLMEPIDLNKEEYRRSEGIWVEIQDQSPEALNFPVQRIPFRMRFQFGEDDYASQLNIPFGVASGI